MWTFLTWGRVAEFMTLEKVHFVANKTMIFIHFLEKFADVNNGRALMKNILRYLQTTRHIS